MKVTLTINGNPFTIDAEAETLKAALADAVRHDAALWRDVVLPVAGEYMAELMKEEARKQKVLADADPHPRKRSSKKHS